MALRRRTNSIKPSDGIIDEGVRLCGTKLIFPIMKIESSKDSQYELELATFVLPKTAIKSEVTPLVERPDLVCALVSALRSYASRVRPSRMLHLTLAARAASIIKFFEFLWINGIYALADCTPEIVEKLPATLGKGGWALALKLEERVSHILNDKSEMRRIKTMYRRKGELSHTKFLWLMGTNAYGRETSEAIKLVRAGLGIKFTVRRNAPRIQNSLKSGLSSYTLRDSLSAINLLSDIEASQLGLKFLPFPTVKKTGKKFGKAEKRTATLKPSDVGAWLRECFRCVDEVGENVCKLLENVYPVLAVRRNGGGILDKDFVRESFRNDANFKKLEVVLGKSINIDDFAYQDIESEDIGLNQVFKDLVSAAFVIIALLNGRRKAEIQDEEFGIRSSTYRVADEKLGIYECDFYVEKTHKKRLSYYIGDATYRAIGLMDRVSRMATAYAALEQNATDTVYSDLDYPIFLIPRIPGVRRGRVGRGYVRKFDFSTVEGAAAERLASIVGGDSTIWTTAHMFRRAYAILFIYRYEDGDMLALSQHLGHLSCSRTRVYVKWVGNSAGGTLEDFAIGSPLDEKLYEIDNSLLTKEILEISELRLTEFVDSIIRDEGRLSGGFIRVIQRFHQRFGSSIKYNFEKGNSQAKIISRSLSEKGHAVTPFPHGNCVASTLRRNSGAGCYNAEEKTINREDAGAHVCGKCPYHILTESNISLMEKDLSMLRYEITNASPNSVQYLTGARKIENLERWIALHRTRITRRGD